MAQATGSLTQFAMYDETTMGTVLGGNGLRLPTISYGVQFKHARKQSDVLQGNRNRTKSYFDEKSCGGPMVIQPDVRSICHIFRHAIGVPTTLGSVGTPVVTDGGTGYADTFAVTFTGGGGAGAAGTATAVAGIIQSFTITNGGTTKYATAPTPVFTAGGGTGATGTVALVAPYEHEFKPGALPPGFTLEPYFTNLTESIQHSGMRINSFAGEVTPSGCLTFNMDLLGVDEENETRLDASPLLYAVEPLLLGSAVLSKTGSQIYTAETFGFTYGNDLDPKRTVGNNGRLYSSAEGFAMPDGTIGLLFESMADYQDAKDGVEDSLKVVFPSPATGTGHQVELEWQEVFFDVPGIPINGPKGITIPYNWMAHYDNGSEAASMVARVTNDLTAAQVLAIAA